jgi:hypothetical protein
VATTSTDLSGHYSLGPLPAGVYKIGFIDPQNMATPPGGLRPVFFPGVDMIGGVAAAYAAGQPVPVAPGASSTADQAMQPIFAVSATFVSTPQGTSATVTVSMATPDPTGTVTFKANGVPTTVALVGGQATYHTDPSLTAGVYAVTVSYSGDSALPACVGPTIKLVVT